jgi:hypothetical protein
MNFLLFSWCLLLVALQVNVAVVESVALVPSVPSSPLWGYRSTLLVRGGGDDDDEEEEDDEEEAVESPKAETVDDDEDDLEVKDDEDEEEEEAEVSPKKESVKLDASLAAAALKSASKAKVSQQASVKKAVNIQLKAKAVSKTSRRIFPRIPYILRASLNPFTLLAMTKSYWASLFNLNYLQQQTASGQELRSAVEEQAKRSPKPSSSFSKRKRTMKRGQAKTLNDLPKLSS